MVDINKNGANEYKIWESDLKTNELLYLPAGWFHEVINDDVSCALSMWYSPTQHDKIRDGIFDLKLPANPNHYRLSNGDLDELFYFIQNMIDSFCDEMKKNGMSDDITIEM